jgi:hypothetical protein
MEKIDRLGWAAGMSIYTYGLRIGIRTNKAEVLERVAERLPRNWEPCCSPLVDYLYSFKVGGPGPRPNVRNFTLLYGGGSKLARTMDLEEALDALESDLQRHVSQFARNHVFIHAGVVGWQGRAILLPGRSMAGKTSLVAALLKAGATYYSDEYAIIDPNGLVHPFPRRLSVRQPGNLKPRRSDPEEFGSRPGVTPLPVGLVAVLKYLPGGRWRPRLLTPGKALLELFDHALAAEHEPEMVLAALEPAVGRAAICWKGVRGEAEETTEKLLAAAAELRQAA